MAHHLYTTDGFVFESQPRAESNRVYLIFTRDLGMVRATAQGVRLLKSKLRFSLQDFSRISLSLVRGKEVWRITNATSRGSLYKEYASSPDILIIIARVFSLVKRLVNGEEKNIELFEILEHAFDFLEVGMQNEKGTEYLSAFERIIIVQILHNLGYLDSRGALAAFLGSSWSNEMLERMIVIKKEALQVINRSLQESQL